MTITLLTVTFTAQYPPEVSGVRYISALTAYSILNKFPKTIILDVRTRAEYDSAHVARSVLLSNDSLQALIRSGKLQKSASYIIYCHTHRRSTDAAIFLQKCGFKHIRVIRGGIVAWQKQRLPVRHK